VEHSIIISADVALMICVGLLRNPTSIFPLANMLIVPLMALARILALLSVSAIFANCLFSGQGRFATVLGILVGCLVSSPLGRFMDSCRSRRDEKLRRAVKA